MPPIQDLAKALLGSYQPLLNLGNLSKLPEQPELENALKKLVTMGLLKIDPTGIAAGVAPVVLDQVKQLVKNIQKGSGALDGDGVLGPKTITWLFRNRHCMGDANRKLDATNTTARDGSIQIEARLINYYIEELPEMMDDKSSEKALKTAFESWMNVSKMRAKRTFIRDRANLIIKTEPIDGGTGQNTLAVADVGPPDNWGNYQGELKIDRNNSWISRKFIATITHELGHVMGLSHSSGPGRIMNPFLGELDAPGEGDIADLRQVGPNFWF